VSFTFTSRAMQQNSANDMFAAACPRLCNILPSWLCFVLKPGCIDRSCGAQRLLRFQSPCINFITYLLTQTFVFPEQLGGCQQAAVLLWQQHHDTCGCGQSMAAKLLSACEWATHNRHVTGRFTDKSSRNRLTTKLRTINRNRQETEKQLAQVKTDTQNVNHVNQQALVHFDDCSFNCLKKRGVVSNFCNNFINRFWHFFQCLKQQWII